MVRSPDEIDFEQYYEDWRHRDTLTWQIPALAVAIGSGIIVGGHIAEIPWSVKALVFGLGALFIAVLTVMLAQNLYYQWRDEKHLENYGKVKKDKPQSRPIPPKTEEEEKEIKAKFKLKLKSRLKRIIDSQRMGSTLLLVTCFLFYAFLSALFVSTWQWCRWSYWVSGICVLVITFSFTFGWFLKWLIRGVEKE